MSSLVRQQAFNHSKTLATNITFVWFHYTMYMYSFMYCQRILLKMKLHKWNKEFLFMSNLVRQQAFNHSKLHATNITFVRFHYSIYIYSLLYCQRILLKMKLHKWNKEFPFMSNLVRQQAFNHSKLHATNITFVRFHYTIYIYSLLYCQRILLKMKLHKWNKEFLFMSNLVRQQAFNHSKLHATY